MNSRKGFGPFGDRKAFAGKDSDGADDDKALGDDRRQLHYGRKAKWSSSFRRWPQRPRLRNCTHCNIDGRRQPCTSHCCATEPPAEWVRWERAGMAGQLVV